jgi:hypothetical protein
MAVSSVPDGLASLNSSSAPMAMDYGDRAAEDIQERRQYIYIYIRDHNLASYCKVAGNQ